MNPRRGLALLQCLITVLVALGPWTLVGGDAADADCCGTSLEMHAAAGMTCCGEVGDQSPPPSCGHGCPAAHCSPVSFLPSVSVFAIVPFRTNGIPPADGIFASQLAAPDTRPPILAV